MNFQEIAKIKDSDSIQSLVWPLSGIITGNLKGELKFYQSQENLMDYKTPTQILSGNEPGIISLDYRNDLVAASCLDGTLNIWNMQNFSLVNKIKPDFIKFIDNDQILITGDQGKLQVYEINSAKKLYEYNTNVSNFVYSVAVSQNQIACGNMNGQVFLLNKTEGTILKKFENFSGAVRTLSFSHDNSMLLAGSDDTTLCLYDTKTQMKICQTQKEHQNIITSCQFNSSQQIFASCSADQTLIIWDLEQRIPIQRINFEDQIWSFSFNNNGTGMACGCDDGYLKIFQAKS